MLCKSFQTRLKLKKMCTVKSPTLKFPTILFPTLKFSTLKVFDVDFLTLKVFDDDFSKVKLFNVEVESVKKCFARLGVLTVFREPRSARLLPPSPRPNRVRVAVRTSSTSASERLRCASETPPNPVPYTPNRASTLGVRGPKGNRGCHAESEREQDLGQSEV